MQFPQMGGMNPQVNGMPGMNMQFGAPGGFGQIPPSAGFQQDFNRQ